MQDLGKLVVADEVSRERLRRFTTDERFRIENLLAIRDLNDRADIPLRFNEAQIKLFKRYRWFRERRMPVRMVICKSRRAGLSTVVASLIYDDTTMNPKTASLVVGHERNPSENVLAMYTRFWRNTPEAMTIGDQVIRIRPPLPAAFRNAPPKHSLSFAEPLDSAIYIASARNIDAYRSFGLQNIHATEAAHYEDGYGLFRAMGATLVRGPHSALYIESTPNGQTGRGAWFYETCMRAKNRKKLEYGETALVFIPWHEMRITFSVAISKDKRDAFERSLTGSERQIMQRWPYITFEQIAWRRMTIASETCGGDEEIFDQEFPSDLATCFLMSGSSVYGRKTIKRLMENSVRPPIWEGDVFWGDSDEKNEGASAYEIVRKPVFLKAFQAREQGRKSHTNEGTYKNLRVWRWPVTGDRLFIVADVCAGRPHTRDGDFSVAYVGCLNELGRDEILMAWRGRLNEVAFAEVLAALAHACWRLVGEAVKAPELAPEYGTNGGKACCTYLDTKNLYPHLYHYEFPGVHNMPGSKHIGFESNGKTKPIMVAESIFMLQQDLIDVPDELLVTEMSSYRQTDHFGDDGSYGGAPGSHDDCVSAFQILCFMLRRRAARALDDLANAEQVGDAMFEPDMQPWDWSDEGAPNGLNVVDHSIEGTDEALYWGEDEEDRPRNRVWASL